jgi:hypothetical protein
MGIFKEAATEPINSNQIRIKDMINDSNGLSNLQFLPEQLKKDFEREQKTIHCQNNLVVPNDSSMVVPGIQGGFEQILDKNTAVSTNIVMDTNKKTINENENNKLDESNFQGYQCSEFGNILFKESYASDLLMKKQPEFTEQTLPPSHSNSDQNSDNKNGLSDDRKFSSDLQSFKDIDTKGEVILADDNILSLSSSCEQIAEKEYSSNDDEQSMNRPSTDGQLIEDTKSASTFKEESHSNDSITEPIKCEILLPTSLNGEQRSTRSPSKMVTRSMVASLNLKVCFWFFLFLLNISQQIKK